MTPATASYPPPTLEVDLLNFPPNSMRPSTQQSGADAATPHGPDKPTLMVSIDDALLTPRPRDHTFELPGYEILGELGRGGMGAVFKARHLHLKRLVALKVILGDTEPSAAARGRFFLEAEAAARLHHPNIIQVHEVGEHDGRPYLVLELVEGPNLASLLRQTPCPAVETARWIAALARAVHAAHEAGIVHRDLKPANILLKPTGRGPSEPWRLDRWIPKVTDFGLAKDLHGAGGTKTGEILGTPAYMAPEQAEAQRGGVGPLADVYALGAILYEMLTGRPPFQGETGWDTIILLATTDAVPPRTIRPNIPVGLETICLQTMAKDPSRRYASALALAEDLERFLAGTRVRARREGWVSRTFRRTRRRPLIPAAVAVLLLLTGLGVAAVWSNDRHDRADAEKALDEARGRFERGDFADAATTLNAALKQARERQLTGELPQELETLRYRAERGRAAGELHRLAENLRFWADPETLTAAQRQPLEAACRAVWSRRDRLTDARGGPLPGEAEDQLRTDLLDLALLWAELHTRAGDDTARREALQVLAEAEALVGPVAAVAWVRGNIERAPGAVALVPKQLDRRDATAWEHYALGRALMHAGAFAAAEQEFSRAVELQPTGFWPTFYQGVCFYRLGNADKNEQHKLHQAIISLSYCVDRARRTPECYYNRAIVYESLSKNAAIPGGSKLADDYLNLALKDYGIALTLEPKLGLASLNRGILFLSRNQFVEAEADLAAALADNAPPATVHYNLAVLSNRQHHKAEALKHLEAAVKADPNHAEARSLLVNLSK